MNEQQGSFPQLTDYSSSSSSFPSSGGWWWSWWGILLFVLGLSLAGFNVFQYLANGTQRIDSFLGPGVKKVVGTLVVLVGTVIHWIADTIKWIVNGFAHGVDTGLTEVESVVPVAAASSSAAVSSSSSLPSTTVVSASSAPPSSTPPLLVPPTTTTASTYQPVQANQGTQGVQGKSGWCYVGSELDDQNNEFGICTQVGLQDTCMSGMVFPTQDLCINPNLRA